MRWWRAFLLVFLGRDWLEVDEHLSAQCLSYFNKFTDNGEQSNRSIHNKQQLHFHFWCGLMEWYGAIIIIITSCRLQKLLSCCTSRFRFLWEVHCFVGNEWSFAINSPNCLNPLRMWTTFLYTFTHMFSIFEIKKNINRICCAFINIYNDRVMKEHFGYSLELWL